MSRLEIKVGEGRGRMVDYAWSIVSSEVQLKQSVNNFIIVANLKARTGSRGGGESGIPCTVL